MLRDNGNLPAKPPWPNTATTQMSSHHKHYYHHYNNKNNKENNKKSKSTPPSSKSSQQHTPIELPTGLHTHQYRTPLQEIRKAHENNNTSNTEITNRMTKAYTTSEYQCPIERRTEVPEGTNVNNYDKKHQYRPTLFCRDICKAHEQIGWSLRDKKRPRFPTDKITLQYPFLQMATTHKEVDIIIQNHMAKLAISTRKELYKVCRHGGVSVLRIKLQQQLCFHHIELLGRGNEAKAKLSQTKPTEGMTKPDRLPQDTAPHPSLPEPSPVSILLQRMLAEHNVKQQQEPPENKPNTSTFSFEYKLQSITIICKHRQLLDKFCTSNDTQQHDLPQQQAITSPRLIPSEEINAQLAHVMRLHARWKPNTQPPDHTPSLTKISSSTERLTVTNPQPLSPPRHKRRQLPPRASQCRDEMRAVKRKHIRWKTEWDRLIEHDKENSPKATTTQCNHTNTSTTTNDMKTITRNDHQHIRYKQYRRKQHVLRNQDLNSRFSQQHTGRHKQDQNKHRTHITEYYYNQDRPSDIQMYPA